jgi:hypothetical protein
VPVRVTRELTFQIPPPYPWAGGGGLSSVFRRAAYQANVRRVVGGRRGVPDVSLSAAVGYDAKRGYDLATGLATVNAARLVPELAGAR